jgi:amino acid permease
LHKLTLVYINLLSKFIFQSGGAWLIILTALAFIKDISKFNYLVLFSDVVLLTLLFTLDIVALDTIAHQGGIANDVQSFIPSSCLILVGMAIYAYTNITLVIPLGTITQPRSKYAAVLVISTIIMAMLYISTALFTYLAFGSETFSLSTLHLSKTSIFCQIFEILYAFTMIPTFVVFSFPITFNLDKATNHLSYGKAIQKIVRILIIFLTLAFAIGFAEQWDQVMGIIGATVGNLLGFFLPPLLHLKLVAKTLCQKIIDWIMIVLSILVFICSTFIIILYWGK